MELKKFCWKHRNRIKAKDGTLRSKCMKPACALMRIEKARRRGNSLHDQKVRRHRKIVNRITKRSRKINR